MDKSLYSKFSANWDDDFFRQVLLKKIKSDCFCLDYGAGRGNVKQMNFRDVAKFIAGVDPEKDVFNNPYLNEAKQLNLQNNVIPYADSTFDVVFSDNVMEHIQDPEIVLKEIHRVLKPGGLFLAKTPNKWHYMPIIARLTPTWFHKIYNKLRGRKIFDTFPTTYKLNSKGAINKYSNGSGFVVRQVQFIEGRPEYLRLTAITYFFGFIYERIVNTTDLLAQFRCVMISELEKPSV
jgi:SAM-dependent methyltransferase